MHDMWEILSRSFLKESKEDMRGFLERITEYRIDYFVEQGYIHGEDWLLKELETLTATADLADIAVFADHIEREKQIIYYRGVLDGIQLIKFILNL